jgi:hypothetical protein
MNSPSADSTQLQATTPPTIKGSSRRRVSWRIKSSVKFNCKNNKRQYNHSFLDALSATGTQANGNSKKSIPEIECATGK